ncbi:hypothetical protein [Devosia sp. Leaf64]|uniref:hypothetical protein n=1 Tax=Devosia sp. Leaf64 TaxID=1736229 RepID=UPI00071598DC|nr:hypothetical protein [Devosia sp. Leaf64]KQN75052.1 hypothetical protein ASE94_01660 [Devosia sp. Leaf64]
MSVPFKRSKLIARLARYGSVACGALMIIIPLATIAYWLLADAGILMGVYFSPEVSLSVEQRIAGLLVTLISVGAIGIVLMSLRALFQHFSEGRLLSTTSSLLVRRIALGVSIYATLIILSQTALSAILTMNAPTGSRVVAFTISSESLVLYAVAAILWLFSLVLAHASDVQQDNEMIV